ncbi:hypothetical protein D9M71_737730 [compost metagenome]
MFAPFASSDLATEIASSRDFGCDTSSMPTTPIAFGFPLDSDAIRVAIVLGATLGAHCCARARIAAGNNIIGSKRIWLS